MKKLCALLSVLLVLSGMAMASCGTSPKNRVLGETERIELALKLYAQANETMARQTYTVQTEGDTAVKAPFVQSQLRVRGIKQYKPGEVYFENISVGKKVLLFNTSFARRAYFRAATADTAQIFRFAEAEDVQINQDGTVNGWNAPQNIDADVFMQKFGRDIGQFSNYHISASTIDATSQGVTYNDDGTVTLHFVLDTSKGIESESVKGYVRQVYTMSGMQCNDFVSATVTFLLDEQCRILQSSVTEQYKVSAGFLDAATSNTLQYTCTFYDTPAQLAVSAF